MSSESDQINFRNVAELIYRAANGGSFDALSMEDQAPWMRAARLVVPAVVGELLTVSTGQANAFQVLMNRGAK